MNLFILTISSYLCCGVGPIYPQKFIYQTWFEPKSSGGLAKEPIYTIECPSSWTNQCSNFVLLGPKIHR